MIRPSLTELVDSSFSERLEFEDELVDQQKMPLEDSAVFANSPAYFLISSSVMATLIVMSCKGVSSEKKDADSSTSRPCI